MTAPATALRIRAQLTGLGRYSGPRPAISVAGRLARLAANECAYGPLPAAQAAIAEAALTANRYPDNECAPLRGQLGAHLGVDPAHVAIGAGSIALLEALLLAVGEPNAEVVYPWPSFEAYPARARLAGARPVAVPLQAGVVDLPAMAAAVTSRTRLVIVCNPNNPTGTATKTGALRAFLAAVPGDCIVALDEAYHDFVAPGRTDDGVDLHRDHPNVAVLRTFSKAHGLAGLRVGYLVAQPALVDIVRRTRVPFAVTQIAQAAASASLGAADELRRRVEEVSRERERMRLAITAAGIAVPDSAANFLWLPLAGRTEEFAQLCHSHGVTVLAAGGSDAGAGVRITVGASWENDRVVGVARDWAGAGARTGQPIGVAG